MNVYPTNGDSVSPEGMATIFSVLADGSTVEVAHGAIHQWTFTPTPTPLVALYTNPAFLLKDLSFEFTLPGVPLYTTTYLWRPVPKRHRRIVNALNRLHKVRTWH